MDAIKRVHLLIVPAERVRPHEIADPAREQRIEARLRQDGVLRDPLMVGAVPDVEGYVLLDGTNRQRALATLGLSAVLVQVLDYADPHAVELRTWCHSAGTGVHALARQAADIPGVGAETLPPLGVEDALADGATLAVLLDRHHRVALRREPLHTGSRAAQLRGLVDVYEPTLVRVDCSPDEAEERAQRFHHAAAEPRTLVAFPRFTRSQVVTTAMSGALIPAGITRHVVLEGRALRVNLPLSMLRGTPDGVRSQEILDAHLEALHPRLYQEPTILYDS